MKERCLYCYKSLDQGEKDFHAACSRKIFGQPDPPELPYSESDLRKLAEEIVKTQTTVTGVQPKLSLHLEARVKNDKRKRFTIVGLWGGYTLKPPTSTYP